MIFLGPSVSSSFVPTHVTQHLRFKVAKCGIMRVDFYMLVLNSVERGSEGRRGLLELSARNGHQVLW